MRVTPDEGVSAVADSFTSPRHEAFHGFGGRHTRLDQRWRVAGQEVPARLVTWVALPDTADYHFDQRSPIVLPDDAERGLEATFPEDGEDDADYDWTLHRDHNDIRRRLRPGPNSG